MKLKFIQWLLKSDENMNVFSKILWAIILTALMLIMFSCSPVKRLERFERKHPYLFDKVTDTITVVDTITVIIPGQRVDTAFHESKLHDTVWIEKNGLRTVIWQRYDTIYVETSHDTIIKEIHYEKKVPVKRYVPYRRPRDWLRWFYLVIVSISVFYILQKWIGLYYRHKKK